MLARFVYLMNVVVDLRIELTPGEQGGGNWMRIAETLATQLLQAGLFDAVLLFTHPVILGRGRPLFDDYEEPVELDLIEQASLEEGVTMHRYTIRGARRWLCGTFTAVSLAMRRRFFELMVVQT